MELLLVIATVVLVVVPLLIAGMVLLVPTQFLTETKNNFIAKALIAAPYLLGLVAILAFNGHFRSTAHNISLWLGIEITHIIVAIEGFAIVYFQEFLSGDAPIIFFTFMYVYGYVFLLVFPLIAYFVLENLDIFKSLTIAYMINYGFGLFLYTVFIAFGPRNIRPELLEEAMYLYYPQLHLLTSAVNEFTNVFPSLHTSLSATVMIFAWHTRHIYERWVPIAMFVGASIIFSTMYLAIHWMIDVVAGIGLAAISYWVGINAVRSSWFVSEKMSRAWASVIESVR